MYYFCITSVIVASKYFDSTDEVYHVSRQEKDSKAVKDKGGVDAARKSPYQHCILLKVRNAKPSLEIHLRFT